MNFATPFNGLNRQIVESNDQPSLTDQSFKQECDIGYIIKTCAKTGQPLPASPMSYVDCTSVQDFQSAMDTVAQCKSAFASLSSADRDRFGTVENYLDFISRSENLKESYEKGYIDPNSVDIKDIYPERYFKEVINEVSGSAAAEPVNSSSAAGAATGPQTSSSTASPA